MGKLYKSRFMCDDGIQEQLEELSRALKAQIDTALGLDGATPDKAVTGMVQAIDGQIEEKGTSEQALEQASAEGYDSGFESGAASVSLEDLEDDVKEAYPAAAGANRVTGDDGAHLFGAEYDTMPGGLLVCRATRRTFRLVETTE